MADDLDASPDRPTDPAYCREFRLSDAMILIAGAAIALACGAHLLVFLAEHVARLCEAVAARGEDVFFHWPLFWANTRDSLRNSLWYGMQVAVVFLFGMIPAFLIVQLRRPRLPVRALLGKPGTVASLATVFGLFWGTGCLLVVFPDKVDSMTAAPAAIGGAVAVAWVALVLSRKWRPERGWIERFGRFLGWAAIASGLISLLVFRI